MRLSAGSRFSCLSSLLSSSRPSSRYHWSDSSISNKHLRIHCVLYEQDPVSGIPPLVYATDVSSNGTVLRTSATGGISAPAGLPMSKQRRSRLLEHGDVLLLSRSVTLVFHSLVPTAENDFTAVQERETNVCLDASCAPWAVALTRSSSSNLVTSLPAAPWALAASVRFSSRCRPVRSDSWPARSSRPAVINLRIEREMARSESRGHCTDGPHIYALASANSIS